MKRELKERLDVRPKRKQRASHTIPMKRELKGRHIAEIMPQSHRFTHHPDEEGTERTTTILPYNKNFGASHTIPMKRELKVGMGAGRYNIR